MLSIVISREYLTRVKKPSFIILTLLMPFLMAGVILIQVLFAMIKDDTVKEVMVIDTTGKYESLLVNTHINDSTERDGYVFLPATHSLEEYRTGDYDVEAIVSITDDLASNPDACRIYSHGEVQQELLHHVEDILQDQIRRDKLKAYNVPQLENIIIDIQSAFSATTVKWGDDGSETISIGGIAMFIGIITATLIYMFVMIYGAMVMQSVMEEKTNRIVEVIIGSVKPFHLMLGKILGVMFVGFTQIFIWVVMLTAMFLLAGVFTSGNIDTSDIQQTSEMLTPDGILTAFANLPLFEICTMFIICFVGGYILYASLYAAIGAAINSQEDSSQFMMPMVIIMIIALYGAIGSMENTNGPLAFWASLFPLTSPIVMMVRIPFGVPLWQEVVSITLLYATALASVWFGGRIYRVGILIYGKKPTFREIWRWM